MDSDGHDTKCRKHNPKSRDGVMASGNPDERRAAPGIEDADMDGPGPAPDSQDTVIECKGQDELAVFVGNLRTDMSNTSLKENIIAVFAVAGVNINTNQVVLVHKAFASHAFIYLTSADEKTWVLNGLGSQLDLLSVAIPGKKLKVRSKSFGTVSYRRPEHSSLTMSTLSERSSIESSGSFTCAPLLNNDGAPLPAAAMTCIDEGNSDDGGVAIADDTHSIHPQKATLATKSPHIHPSNPSFGQVEPALTSITQPSPQTTHAIQYSSDIPSIYNNSMETQTQTMKQAHSMSKTSMKFYVVGQNLGNESRHVEFKAGQGSYLQKQLKDHVAKYMCAFLNSEGGTLLVGVNDSDISCYSSLPVIIVKTSSPQETISRNQGEVLGIQCTQHIEDLLRQKMDATIKEIAPQVFPNMYTIDFVPVCDISSVPIENRKILEITVKRTNTSSLYQTHQGHVFIRRDGSVQGPLKASDIQEWTRMMMRKELEEREVALQAVQEKDRLLEREMDKQRRMTMILTRELKTQRNSTRQLKAQLRRVNPKQLRHMEAVLVVSDQTSVSEDDVEREYDNSHVISHVATSMPVTTTVTAHAGTTTRGSGWEAQKTKTRSGSIISRISSMIKPHKSTPAESTPSQPKKAVPLAVMPLNPQNATPLEDTPSHPQNSTPLEGTPSHSQNATPLDSTPSHSQNVTPLDSTPSRLQNETHLEGTPSNPHKATHLEGILEVAPLKNTPSGNSCIPTSSEESFAVSEKDQLTFGIGHDGVKIPVGTAVVPRKRPMMPRMSLHVESHSTNSRSCAIM